MFSLQVDRMAKPTTSDYTRGALYGLAAVCIWASISAAMAGWRA